MPSGWSLRRWWPCSAPFPSRAHRSWQHRVVVRTWGNPSLNRYEQFDVRKLGAILNNAPAIVTTQRSETNINLGLVAARGSRLNASDVNQVDLIARASRPGRAHRYMAPRRGAIPTICAIFSRRKASIARLT